MVADFSGYATKAGLKCSDGRTIMPEAFKHMDGMTVPLVWQHGHGDTNNVLGHAVLEARTDGVYAYGYFNGTKQGQNAKVLVEHKDITNLSIYANKLIEKAKQVFHGTIREVSLVLSGANPGALIDNVTIAHGDGVYDELEDEAIIHTGLPIEFEDPEQEEDLEHAGDQTVQDVFDSFTPEQQNVVYYMVGQAIQNGTASHSDDNDEGDLNHQEGSSDMSRNVFEQQNGGAKEEAHVLTHDAMKGIVAAAEKSGSMKQAVEEYALAHGIDNMAVLFPDAQNVTGTPEFIKRRTEWVAGVLGGTHHTPFSRIKTLTADITQDEARAKGYIKGTYKKEEWFSVAKRTTSPTTVYKKQKLDRDDIIDITDFDIVAWMKGEMRLMLEEELAGAILLGDGRDVSDPDKIQDPLGAASGSGLRSIINDHELYVTTVNVNIDDALPSPGGSSYLEVVESVLRARRFYKGSGTPTFYTTEATLVEMLLTKDTQGRRLWPTKADLAAALMVDTVVAVEIMETRAPGVVGIIVNLQDYNIGADKGGEVNLFDDFDIDYNQYKYLIETRISGALTKVKSALVIRKTAAANVLINPISAPTMNPQTYVVTVPTQTNVVYKNAAGTTLTAGAQPALTAGQTLVVNATPAAGYYFATTAEDQWTFFRRS